MTKKFKHGVVFGVFDKFHEGHRFFLQKASGQTEKCTAIVARDAVVEILKNKGPVDSEQVRLANVLASGYVAGAELGDEEMGVYSVIKCLRPDVICLGYDQIALRQDLQEKMKNGILPSIPLITIEAYQPHRFHTSLLYE